MMRATALAAAVIAGALLAAPGWAQDEPTAGAAPPVQPRPVAKPIVKEMAPPKITVAAVDWNGARTALSQLPGAQAGDPKPDGDTLLARINTAANGIDKDIARSSVPVLLPVDASTVLRAKAESLPAPEGDIAGFKPHFFFAGPAGYDAAFTLAGAAAGEVKAFAKKEDPVILISGFALTYDLDPPVAEALRPIKDLEAQYPGIRRRFLENYMRYSFEKFGTPYTVSMLCHDGRAHVRWVTCKEADAIIQRFLKTLQVAGGTPQQLSTPSASATVERPKEQSPDFTFAAPGRLIEKTGLKDFDGKPDWTVYAKIRFPLDAPAYANSQAFLNWGNCDFTGTTLRRQKKDAPYHCKVNDKPLVFNESAAENHAYPWRDNFCEHRRYYVGQCPGGEGHQGQDIRPSTCKLLNEGADRCLPFNDNVVAVRDGMIMRQPQRESLYLYVNAPGEHVRFRYLHMHPEQLDGGNLLSGRVVKEGEVLGKVGNFDRIPNGTTYHLHFELQVPSRDGWVFVSPYATLISSYERLIGGRGREFIEPEPAPKPEVVAEKTVEKPAKPARQARGKRHAPAKTAAAAPKPAAKTKAAARPSAADATPAVNVIGGGLLSGLTGNAERSDAAKKDAPGARKSERKTRRTTADCKASAAGGNACQPRAARQRTGANGV